jgi:hypothetical protein
MEHDELNKTLSLLLARCYKATMPSMGEEVEGPLGRLPEALRMNIMECVAECTAPVLRVA